MSQTVSVTSAAPPSSFAAAPSDPQTVMYPVKWIIDEHQRNIPICMQNQNGPCALLALMNASLILCDTNLTPGTTSISEAQIMTLLADHVSLTANEITDGGDAERQAIRQFAVTDFLDLLPSLNRGLDVNVRFDSPVSFEFTRQLSVFDVFPHFRLVHGWLVDPQDARLTVALSQISYNQLVDELVRTQHSFSELPPGATAPPEDAFVTVNPTAPPPPSDVEPFAPSPPPPPPTDSDSTIPPPPPDNVTSPFSHLSILETNIIPDMEGPSAPPPPPPPQENGLDENALAPEMNGLQSEIEPVKEDTITTINIREMRPQVMEFLELNPTQLTVYGLLQLHATLTEGETAILFRNSHFHVLRKKEGEIYTLITDVGFLNELNIVWEKLSDITGDSTFFNGSFQRLRADGSVQTAAPTSTEVNRNGATPRATNGSSSASANQSRLNSSTNTNNISTPTQQHVKSRGRKGRPNGCCVQ